MAMPESQRYLLNLYLVNIVKDIQSILESDLAFTGKSVGIAPMKGQLKLRSLQSL